LSCTYIA